MTFKSSFMAVIMAAVMAVVMPGAATAQSADQTALKIVIVNVDAIRAESTAYKKANEQFKAFSDTINAELATEDEALRKEGEELGRKRTLMAPEAFAEDRKKFEERVAAFQRKVQERQKAMADSQAQAVGQINRRILEITSEYAEANQVSLVLPESVTVLSAKSMNINAHVLEQLNKTLPSVEVKAPGK